MKKITLMIVVSLLSVICSYAQSGLPMEGFETGWTLAPNGTSTTGWFTMQNDVGTEITWVQGAANSIQQPAYEGERAAYLQRQNVLEGIPEDYLVTPEFIVPDDPELRFFSRLTVPIFQGSIYKIFIINLTATPDADLNSPVSYTEIQSWTEFEINPVKTDYFEKVVPIPAEYIGARVRIAFMMAGDDKDRWLIDNAEVVKKCIPPTALQANIITLYTAELNWDNPAGAEKWDIELLPEGENPTGTPNITYEDNLPYQATNLTEDTCYKYYVRARCEGGGKSGWVGPLHFCTQKFGDTCNEPILVTSLPFTDTDDTATFDNNYNGAPGTGCNNIDLDNYLEGNDAVYKYTADFTGEINIDLSNIEAHAGVFVYSSCSDIGVNCLIGDNNGTNADDIFIDGFNVVDGNDYYFVVSTFSKPSSPYTLTIQAVACDEPVGLPVENIDMTTAEFSWTDPTGATLWNLAVQTAGTGVPQNSGETVTDNTNYVWDDLTPGTAYEYWVRSDCGNDTFSAWAGPYYFNTMACDPIDQCIFTFTMWDEWDGWSGNTMAVKQNGVTVATLTGPGDDGLPVSVDVPLCNTSNLQLFWNSGGLPFSDVEVGVSITNSFNQHIYTKPPGQGTPNSLLYSIGVDCERPYCFTPKDLTATNITETSVTMGWNGPATGEWEYYIVEADQPAPTNNQPGTLTTSNPAVNSTPLTPATNYKYYVRLVCENSFTEWSAPLAFSTSVCDPEAKCDYKFVLTNYLGWGGWQGAVMTVRQNGTNVALLGPTFTEEGNQTMTVSLCPDTPFDIFWNTLGNAWEGTLGVTVINKFNQTVFDLPAGAGGINTIIYSGEVNCDTPECIPPTGLTASNETLTSVDLAWDGPAEGDWEYYIVEAGNPAPTNETTGTHTSTNPVTVPLAAPATKYEYYVRMICSVPDMIVTDWAGPYTVNSQICDDAEKCIFLFELKSFSPNGFEGNVMAVYQEGILVQYLGNDFFWGDTQTVEVALCPDKEMEIVWEDGGWNSDGKGLHVYSPYMEDVYIKTFEEGTPGTTLFTGMISCEAPACPRPLNPTASDPGLTSITLAWDEMGTADSWEVWVLPLGSPAPTQAGTIVTSNPTVWTQGLSPSTAYVYYVRAICDESTDNISTLSPPFNFVTAIGNETCDIAFPVPVNTDNICTTSVTGTLTGAVVSGVTSSCLIFNEPNGLYKDVWYKFVATSTRHAISIRNQFNVQVNYVVFEGTDCNDLTEILCSPNENNALNNNGIVEGLTIGNTYLIQLHETWVNPGVVTRFEICITTPRAITVDTTTYTPEQIVTNTLVTENCTTIDNIIWSTGSNFGQKNGIGYFEKGDSSFPIEKGIILMTGDAKTAIGPNTRRNDVEEPLWPGDDDLFNYIQELGIDPDAAAYVDATVVEFDFTPLSNKIKFPFIFASSEYGSYQCEYSDAFAFFLTTDNGSGPVTVNLALVPETSSPVSVITIRDDAFNLEWNDCPSVNEEYFDKYYGNNNITIQQPELAIDPLMAPINFEGHTVTMFAQADVVPNQVYHIKLVIADRNDQNLDSAVFIGKFEIGSVDLGADLTIENGKALCVGSSHTIESGLDPNNYTFKWFKDTTEIVGETGENLVVTSTGSYSLEAAFNDGCTTEDTIIVEFYPDLKLITGNPVDLTFCDPDGFGTFNLSDNTAVIVGNNPNDYTVTYHDSEAQAQANEDALPLTNYENAIQFEQVIYVRIVDTKGCVGIKSFKLLVQDLTPLFTITQGIEICQDTVGTEIISVTPVNPANYDPAVATYSWTLNGEALPDTTASITALEIGVYEVTVNNTGCIGTATTTVTVKAAPVPDKPANVIACVNYSLPALSPNNNYYTGTGGTGQMLSAGDIITSTQTVYVFAESATAPKCTAESSFTVTIIPTAIIATNQGCEGSEYTLEVLFDEDPIYSADNTTIEWTDSKGAVVGNQAKLVVTEVGIYTVTVIPNGDIECPVSDDVIVDATTCIIPRGISPNNDGKNDEFDLSSLNVKHLSIFNRYGKEVYTKDNYKKEFFGQGTHGDDLPTGTYFYMIEREGGESITGWLYINRNE